MSNALPRNVSEVARVLEAQPELLARVEALGESQATEQEPQRERSTLPEFPKAAWRGVFAHYRTAMEDKSKSGRRGFLGAWIGAGDTVNLSQQCGASCQRIARKSLENQRKIAWRSL